MFHTKTILLSILFVFSWTQGARAAIGQSSSVIATDCQEINGSLSVVNQNGKYECRATGYTVDFYTNNQGLITKITWQGRRTPPLAKLLGSYSAEYQAAFAKAPVKKGLARSVHHETTNLIVRRAGHARLHIGEINLKTSGS